MNAYRDLLVSLLSRDPALAFELLRHQLLGVPRDPWARTHPLRARSEPGPTIVLVAHEPRVRSLAAPRLALCVQTPGSRDRRAPGRWADEEVRVLAQLGCPTRTAIVTADEGLARWVAGMPRANPAILGPSQIPRVRSVAAARRRPTLALLSVLAHGRDDRRVCAAALLGLDELSRDADVDLDTDLDTQLELEHWRELVLTRADPGYRRILAREGPRHRSSWAQGASLRRAHSAP